MSHPPQTPVRWSRCFVGALLAAAALLLLPAAASASTDFTWSGAASAGSPGWSTGTNWGGSEPGGAVGTLSFPALTSGACTAEPPTAACYESHNDLSGLSPTALAIDDGVGYFIDGNGITLGSGGIDASTSPDDIGFGIFPELALPIELGATQTWSIEGGSLNQELAVGGNVTGQSHALAVAFSGSYPFLGLADAEVGAVTVTGEGGIDVSESLNGSDGNAVTLDEGADLYGRFGSAAAVGPLTTLEDDGVVVGQLFEGGAGTLAANGNVTLDPSSTLDTYIDQPGTVAGTDFSQLSASGNVTLAGAHLSLSDGEYATGGPPACEALTPGDVDTLVSATGSVTGTFNGIPNETVVPVNCPAGGTSPTARIDYTAHTVTATILTAGSGGAAVGTSTALQVSNAAPGIGEAVTLTATVTPATFVRHEPAGSVEFLDGGTPIGSCAAQPLTPGVSSSTATCTLSYSAAGSHSITASYGSEGHFGASSSTAHTVTVSGGSAGGGGGGGGGSSQAAAVVVSPVPTSLPTAPAKKALKCKKGFRKTKKHGKEVCVRIKRGKRGRKHR